MGSTASIKTLSTDRSSQKNLGVKFEGFLPIFDLQVAKTTHFHYFMIEEDLLYLLSVSKIRKSNSQASFFLFKIS